MLDRKLQAAHAYAELRGEVESALQRFGTEPFRTECLLSVDLSDPYGWEADRIPFYEVLRGAARGERCLRARRHVP